MAEDPDKKRKAAVIDSSIASARAKIEQEQVELATIASGGVREMESQVRKTHPEWCTMRVQLINRPFQTMHE